MDRLTATGKPVYSRTQSGFTLFGLLFLLAGLGIGLAAVGTLWSTAVKRDKERELLFIGHEFRRAIESFWEVPLPEGTPRRLPRDFKELLSDPRFPHTVRHLRRIYRDPMTGETIWGLITESDGGISGVHSLSMETPMKQAGFELWDADFVGREQYSEWVFAFKPTELPSPAQKQSNPSTQQQK